MKKVRLSVYLDPEIIARLTELADRKKQPKSLVAEAAITSFLTPDDADQLEAALARRLDFLTRQVERLERDLTIAVEALALFIRFWLVVTPSLPESAQTAAQAKGRERYESFLETLGRRLSKGQSLLREVSIDRVHNGVGQQTDSTATVQSRPNEAQP
jgi:predicted transcriptional regulator